MLETVPKVFRINGIRCDENVKLNGLWEHVYQEMEVQYQRHISLITDIVRKSIDKLDNYLTDAARLQKKGMIKLIEADIENCWTNLIRANSRRLGELFNTIQFGQPSDYITHMESMMNDIKWINLNHFILNLTLVNSSMAAFLILQYK